MTLNFKLINNISKYKLIMLFYLDIKRTLLRNKSRQNKYIDDSADDSSSIQTFSKPQTIFANEKSMTTITSPLSSPSKSAEFTGSTGASIVNEIDTPWTHPKLKPSLQRYASTPSKATTAATGASIEADVPWSNPKLKSSLQRIATTPLKTVATTTATEFDNMPWSNPKLKPSLQRIASTPSKAGSKSY